MNSLFETVFSVLFIYALFIFGIYLLQKLFSHTKRKQKENKTEKMTEESQDRIIKIKELKEIEKEDFKALGHIKIFLSKTSLDNKFLREVVVPEFNRNSPALEHLPLNLSDEKLHKAIQEKAEEYYATSNPLLEILAEFFVSEKHQ